MPSTSDPLAEELQTVFKHLRAIDFEDQASIDCFKKSFSSFMGNVTRSIASHEGALELVLKLNLLLKTTVIRSQDVYRLDILNTQHSDTGKYGAMLANFYLEVNAEYKDMSKKTRQLEQRYKENLQANPPVKLNTNIVRLGDNSIISAKVKTPNEQQQDLQSLLGSYEIQVKAQISWLQPDKKGTPGDIIHALNTLLTVSKTLPNDQFTTQLGQLQKLLNLFKATTQTSEKDHTAIIKALSQTIDASRELEGKYKTISAQPTANPQRFLVRPKRLFTNENKGAAASSTTTNTTRLRP